MNTETTLTTREQFLLDVLNEGEIIIRKNGRLFFTYEDGSMVSYEAYMGLLSKGLIVVIPQIGRQERIFAIQR